jgi:hypothetical protein
VPALLTVLGWWFLISIFTGLIAGQVLRRSGRLLIDCKEERAARAVLVGLLAEMEPEG